MLLTNQIVVNCDPFDHSINKSAMIHKEDYRNKNNSLRNEGLGGCRFINLESYL